MRSIFLNSIFEYVQLLRYKYFFLSFQRILPFFISNFSLPIFYPAAIIQSSILRVTAQPSNKLSSTSTYGGIAKRKHWITATSDFLWRNGLAGVYTDLVVRMSTNIENFLFKSRVLVAFCAWKNEEVRTLRIRYCCGLRVSSCISIISNYFVLFCIMRCYYVFPWR